MNNALDGIQKQLTGNDVTVDLIGHQVFWTLSENCAVSYNELKQVAIDAGFEAKSHKDGGVLPRETTPCSAWTRAIDNFKKSDQVREYEQAQGLELVIDSENIPADSDTKTPAKGLLTVHIKNVDGKASEVSFEQQIAIEYDKSATTDQSADQVIQTKNGEGVLAEWVSQSIKVYYDQNLSRVNVNDVRETIKRILHQVRAFKMKPSGGIYFVPVAYTKTVEALKQFVGGLKDSYLYTLDLPKVSVRTVETIQQTAAEAMEDELKMLVKDINTGLQSSRLQKLGTESKTHGRLMELINDYRARAEFYSDFLTIQKDEISSTISTLENKVMQAVSA